MLHVYRLASSASLFGRRGQVVTDAQHDRIVYQDSASSCFLVHLSSRLACCCCALWGTFSSRNEVLSQRLHNLSITFYLGTQPRLGKLSGVELSAIARIGCVGLMSMLIR